MNTSEEKGGDGENTGSSSDEKNKYIANVSAIYSSNERQTSSNGRQPVEEDDGSHYFMSEPSVSEEGSEQPSMRGLAILSPQDSLSETLSPSSDNRNHQMIGNLDESGLEISSPTRQPLSPRADVEPSPPRAGTPLSPGGTSLSSRDSPFWTTQYHFMAYPPGESDHSAGGSFEGSRHLQAAQRASAAKKHHQAHDGSSDAEADGSSQNERKHVNGTTNQYGNDISTPNLSDDAASFLYHLRQQSVGAFMVSDPGVGVADEDLKQEKANLQSIIRSSQSGSDINNANRANLDKGSDRKHLDRHKRKKSSNKHRRTRSGDEVAAMIMTGGTEWRGMEGEGFPAPPLYGRSDDDDDDDAQVPLGIRQSSGEDETSRMPVNRSGMMPPQLVSQTSQGFTAVDRSPLSFRNDQGADLWSLSDTTMSPRHKDRERLGSNRENSVSTLPSYVDHRESYSGSISTLGYGGAESKPSHISDSEFRRQDEKATRSDSDSPQHESRKPSTSQDNSAVSENSSASSSKFSWISGSALAPRRQSQHPPPYPTPQNPPRPSIPEGDNDVSSSESASSYYSSEEFSDEGNTHTGTSFQRNIFHDPQMMRDPTFPPHAQRVFGPLHSPFANFGKTKREFLNKKNYAPTTLAEDADKYPTFVCPRCETRQRAFFDTATAPTQDSPAGYLAFYFFIYVIASLYIFGLQEGWNALDCVYFAVITLTTAGLGDFVPTSDGAKVICSIFIYFGVACIGLLLGSYLAGSLDEVSRKEANANRIDTCINCNRLKELKAASKAKIKARVKITSVNSPASLASASKFMSEGPQHANTQPHPAVYERAEKRHRPPGNMEMPGLHQRSNPAEYSHLPGPVHLGGSYDSQQSTPSQFSSSGVNSQGSSLDVIGNTGRNDSTFSSPPLTTTSGHPASPMTLGSPVTARIMHRQRHTRHASLDIGSDMFNEMNPNPFGRHRERRFSEEGGLQVGPTIPEGQPAPSPPPSFFGRSPDSSDSYYDESDSDESISDSSESSFLDAQDMKQPISRVKTAKYVFLTLKQAVMNSIFIITIGGTGFYFIEKMSAIDSFYFTTSLLTTVGYGDLTPVTAPGKLFATVYVLVAGTVLLHNMSTISMIPLELRKRRIERAVLTQFGDQLDDATLRELATGPLVRRLQLSAKNQSGLDECTREMFALAMLVRLGKVTEHDIRMTFAAFRRLDVGNDGILNSQDIIVGMMQKRRQSSVTNMAAYAQEAAAATRESSASSTASTRPWYFFGRHGSVHQVVESPENVPFQYASAEDMAQSEQQALLNASMSVMDNRYSSMQMSHVRLNSFDAGVTRRSPQAMDVEAGYYNQNYRRSGAMSTSF